MILLRWYSQLDQKWKSIEVENDLAAKRLALTLPTHWVCEVVDDGEVIWTNKTVQVGLCNVCGLVECYSTQECDEERERQRGQCDLCGESEPHEHDPEEYNDPYPDNRYGEE